MKKLIIFTIVLFAFFMQNVAQAQIKIDVKTKVLQKTKEMQAVKAGILAMIKEALWMKNRNVGEDYSLWIENLKIIIDPNDHLSSIVDFDLKLNTPAMFTRGKNLQSEHINFKCKKNDVLPIKDPPKLLSALEKLNKTTGFLNNRMLDCTPQTAPISLSSKFLSAVSDLQKFSDEQQTMGLWAGYYTLNALYKMLQKQGEFQ